MSDIRSSSKFDKDDRKGRILVIDDDPDFAEGLTMLLASDGYEVEVAHSTGDATRATSDFRPEVALVDVRLAGGNGIELISSIRRRRPQTLCIMTTAVASTETAVRALQDGAYGYLIKPFDRNELLLTLQRCFELLKLERQKEVADAALRTRHHALERALDDLAKSEQRYRSLVDTCPICIKEIDLSGKLISMNLCGLAMMGFDNASDAKGLDYFDLLAAEDRDRVRAEFSAACSGKVRNFESIAVLDSGRRVVACSFAPLRRSDGTVHRIMGITQDITERKAAEERLQEENVLLKEEVKAAQGFDEIIGNDPVFRRSLHTVKKVAPTDITVLVQGETGTGKELIARAIHGLSNRAHMPLVSVNCPALPATLIESELFGHEKGAFTGARSLRKGRFELANGGTLFLDEMADLPIDLQGKLLRVLQEGEFERLGGSETLHSDVRLIAATNRDLKQAVQRGEFRADLYYRISGFPIQLPALRDRADDIPLLAEHFIVKHANRLGKSINAISSGMLDELVDYSWPGNIRELETVIIRALISTTSGSVLRLPGPLRSAPGENEQSVAGRTELATVERTHITSVLEQCGWTIAGVNGAASALGLPPSTLRSKMKRLGIERRSA